MLREMARREKCRSLAKPRQCIFNALIERGAPTNCRRRQARQGIAAPAIVRSISHRPVSSGFERFTSQIIIGALRASSRGVWIQ